jgi:molecular chaperone GrpE
MKKEHTSPATEDAPPETPAVEAASAAESVPTPPPAETDPLAILKEKLAAAEDRYLRLAAEYENYRKRTSRDQQEARIATRVDTLMSVIGVLDHFRLAMAAADTDTDPKVLRDGMNMILVEFEKAMEDAGVSIIDAADGPFSPQLHEASAREPSETVPENHVIRQWRCGYRLGERLIRPAAVVVSSGPPPSAIDASADDTEGE